MSVKPNPHGNYYERKAYRELRAPLIAAEKAAKTASAKTCQCCFRPIFAESGVIAHHGYERPGQGWQTASCMGARHLPLEAAHDRLDDLICRLEARLSSLGETLGILKLVSRDQNLRHPVPLIYTSKSTAPSAYERRHGRRHGEKRVMATRGSWETDYAAYVEDRLHRPSTEPTYDRLLGAEIGRIEQQITFVNIDLGECRKHRANWKQTHRAGGEGEAVWVAL
jgi:hypothetical protein